MARKPNFDFERRERERQKAQKAAEKAQAKRDARASGQPQDGVEPSSPDGPESEGGH